MDNQKDTLGILKEAEGELERSKREANWGDIVAATRNAQLAIEKSAKAVISCFEAFKWTHDPSDQIKKLVKEGKLKENFLELADWVYEASPWHGRSTYGGRDKRGIWKHPSEWCTKEVATRLILLAEKSIKLAKAFIDEYFK